MKDNDSIQERVVSIIPSESLKKKIRETGFRLFDMDLLATAYEYAPDQDTRFELLRLMEDAFSDELRAYTSRIIQVQTEMLEAFSRNTDGVVFELHIKDTPDAYEERYLCGSLEAAMQMIPLFYKEYNCTESGFSRFWIVKRRVLSEETGFSEDALGVLDLLPGVKIASVDVYAYEHKAEQCGGQCMDCVKNCVRRRNSLFPSFIRHGDAVRWMSPYGGESFGIVVRPEEPLCSDYTVIPLDSCAICRHDYSSLYDGHRHLPAPLLERIDGEALPDRMRENYAACLAYLRQVE